MRRALPAAVLLACLTACSTSAPQPAAAPSQPVRPKCADVFKPGVKVDFAADQAAQGCADPGGGLQIVGVFQCGDGRRLFQVDATSGAPKGWGFDGDVYYQVQGEVAADKGYSVAYRACTG